MRGMKKKTVKGWTAERKKEKRPSMRGNTNKKKKKKKNQKHSGTGLPENQGKLAGEEQEREEKL